MKTPKGAGLTVRIGGRRVNKTELLEEQIRQHGKKLQELLKQNEILKTKEAMQRGLLDSFEASLHHKAVIMLDGPDNNAVSESPLLSAAVLDIAALELMQQLHPTGAQGAEAAPTVGSTSRIKRCLAIIKTEDVLDMQSITAEGLAGRFKSTIARIALARSVAVSSLVPAADTVDTAVNELVKQFLLAVLAADDQLMQSLCLNLETLQPGALPEGLWSRLASLAQLRPEQCQHICTAFDVYMQQRAPLLQQQDEVVRQLQALLGAGQIQEQQQQQQQQEEEEEQQQQQEDHQQQQEAGQGSIAAHAAPVVTVLQESLLNSTQQPLVGGQSGAEKAQSADLPSSNNALTANAGAGNSCPSPRKDPNGAHPGSGSTSSGDSTNSNNSSSTAAPAGLLTLESAVQADSLLQQLLRLTGSLKQLSRRLCNVWIDTLDGDQHASVVLAAYPFNVKFPALCAAVWQQAQQQD